MFKTRASEDAFSSNGDAQTSTLQVAMMAGQKTQWLMLCRPQGVVEVSCHVILSSINGYRLCVDLDPAQIVLGVLNHRYCIP